MNGWFKVLLRLDLSSDFDCAVGNHTVECKLQVFTL